MDISWLVFICWAWWSTHNGKLCFSRPQTLPLKPLGQASLQNFLSQSPLRSPGGATAEQGCGTAAVGLPPWTRAVPGALACIWQWPTANPACDSSRDDKEQSLTALCVPDTPVPKSCSSFTHPHRKQAGIYPIKIGLTLFSPI